MLSIPVQIKLLRPSSKPPEYQTDGSAGMDLRADIPSLVIVYAGGPPVLIPCGFSLAIPPGFEAQIRSRSGLATKSMITVINSPGTIDSDYRGEIGVALVNSGVCHFTVNPGDRIAQMVFNEVARAKLTAVSELSETVRGSGGFGSTGVSDTPVQAVQAEAVAFMWEGGPS